MRKNKHRGIESLKSRYGLMFIAPWFLGFVLFFAIPVFQSVWFSLSDVTLSNSGLVTKFVGLSHYRYALLQSGAYTASGVHNLLEPVFYELSGKTWGLYGYGSIGKRVAQAAKAFGCEIAVCRRHPADGQTNLTLPELFETSDIISLHTPLNEQTLHSVNRDVLKHAAKKPILINAARGAVVDEEAVACAVESGLLSGFATDVYEGEPMRADSPLRRLAGRDNVLFTPHMAWGAYEARKRLVEEVYRNIEAFLNGETRSRVDCL